jgi:hypothetical protein
MLSHLLWAEILLAATLLQYTAVNDWIRQVAKRRTTRALAVAILVVLLVAGMRWSSLLLAVWTAGVLSLLDAFHEAADRRKMGAELHVAGALLLAAGTGWIIGANGLQPRMGPIVLPVTANRVAAVCLVASLVLFAGRGGTLIVRGVLSKAGTLPTLGSGSGDRQIDTAEYNRGRLIGDLERLLLIVSVAVQAYAAMAFIIEDRNFAEYFLIGTLTSVVVALVLGLLVRATILNLW